MIFIVSALCLIVGTLLGWLGAEKYIAFMQHVEHDFEQLFKENPHPEIYNKEGKIDRGDYMALQFETGFDPEEWDPETDIEIQE